MVVVVVVVVVHMYIEWMIISICLILYMTWLCCNALEEKTEKKNCEKKTVTNI